MQVSGLAGLPATELVVTEKLDGTNARIVCFSDGSFVIGSRAELLHARGDVVHNPAMGIVDAVRAIAVRFADANAGKGTVVTLYGEVFGGKTTGSKAYGTSVGFRLFDAISTSEASFEARLGDSPEALAYWRDGGGQAFVDEAALAVHATTAGVELAPRLAAEALPTAIEATHRWLQAVLPGATHAPLEGERKGKPEGAVVRTRDRSAIAKLRFEDYERTLR